VRADPYLPVDVATWTGSVLVDEEHVGVLAVQAPPGDPAVPSRETVQVLLARR
jgi:hypothetical protein